ncbi:tetratricopeptide repeat protein [Tunturiibacter lichenicola]|uniref:hypothetical protein n=1 Tax=Tunturiibacter lichenicola TaxID=2051959 RepID=UPI0021B25406|nr:hypothetical protein [Edaphobacter lichenicola]
MNDARHNPGSKSFAGALLVAVAVAGILVCQKKYSHRTQPLVEALAAERTQSGKDDAKDQETQRESFLRASLENDPHDEAAYSRLRELMETKRNDRLVLEIVETWIAHNPPDFETMLHLQTTATIGLDDPEEAIREERSYLKRVMRKADPRTWESVEVWLAEDLTARGYYSEALTHYKHEATIENTAAGWCDLAGREVTLGMSQQAIADYRRSLSSDAGYRHAHSGLSKAYTKIGDFQHAETEARAAISIAVSELKDEDKARRELRNLDGHDTVLSRLHEQFARVYLSEGKLQNAIEEEILAQESDPDDFEAAMIEAMIYDHMGAADKSQAVTEGVHRRLIVLMSQEKAKDKDEFLSIMSRWENLMVLGRGEGDFDNEDDDGLMARTAIWYLEPQLRAGTLKPAEEMLLGKRYCEVGRVGECEKIEVIAMRANEKLRTAKAEHSLGIALLKAKDPVAANEYLRAAYELDPQNRTYRFDYQSEDSKRTL